MECDAAKSCRNAEKMGDYFTPNIKAEVILDTLLTPYAAEIINRKYGLETVFVTKQMSVRDIKKQTENQKYGYKNRLYSCR